MMINQSCVDAGTQSACLNKTNVMALVSGRVSMYRLPQVMAQATARCSSRGNTSIKMAQSRPLKSWGFFTPSVSLYGGTCGAGLSASILTESNPTTNAARSATQTCSRVRGGSYLQNGTDLMSNHAQNPSVTSSKAAAHRAMAIAALHADSSLSVRLKRYNAQMEIARSLEAQAVAK
ncbi:MULTISPECIES: hypothetical protein [unclassified Pseudomonas]|uniref:hypothetical protein n=1 Tax=unclassified Pseudomonas TaxID=196821 RepID=UPI002B23ED3E|nr:MULTISPECIES: hypothetical protein [unclassified Pseudomonas]MEA9976299.1 hypothetical protein [Pseudomonas sp. RTS4]MEB0197631.1 hypothetical protein [Pseudomonas sp. 5S4]MEB0246123.1 hypothetical protein [Pseudomonas sp. 10S5]